MKVFSVSTLVIGLALIGYLRHVGTPALLDRGEGQPRDWADHHTKYHVGGAAAVAGGVALVGGAIAGAAVSLALWTAVELAQGFPREGSGYFEWPDMLWNVVGAVGGAAIGSLLRRWVTTRSRNPPRDGSIRPTSSRAPDRTGSR